MFSPESLYPIYISMNSFSMIKYRIDHIETYVVRLDSTFILYCMCDLLHCVFWKDIHSKECNISGFKTLNRLRSLDIFLMFIAN